MTQPSEAKPWLVRLLGGVAVEHDGQVWRQFRTRKAVELLAWLAWHVGQPQDREALVSLLWPDAELAAGRNRLSFALSNLRAVLPRGDDSPLGASQRSIWLDDGRCRVDAACFQAAAEQVGSLEGAPRVAAARAAVGWYGGSFAAGLDADWTSEPAATLGRCWHDLMRELIAAAQAGGRDSDAEALLAEARRVDPSHAPAALATEAAVSAIGGLVTYVATIRCWPAPAGAYRVAQPDDDVCVTAFGSPRAAMGFVSEVLDGAPSARIGLDLAEPAEADDAVASRLARRLCRAAHAGQTLATSGPTALLRRAGRARALRLGQFVPAPGAAEETVYQLGLPGAPRTTFPAPSLLEPRAHGQPTWLTRFVGRGAELLRLQELLLSERQRLVTLAGPAGIGKTRLAAAAAALVAPSFDSAVWFASLGGCDDPARLPSMLRDALQTGPQVDADPFEAVCEALGGQRSLLVLDGVDAPVRGAERWLFRLLTRAPRVTCLVTAQRPVSLEGEAIVRLGPLWPPPEDATPEAVFANDATRLLLDRIERQGLLTTLGPAEAGLLGRLCRCLEGVPLALELAAASICADGLQAAGAAIEAAAARRTARGQGLPTALAAAWRRLSAPERRFLEQLTAMPAAFTAAQAGGILEQPDADELVAGLRRAGLLRLASDSDGVRLVVPGAVRRFAQSRRSPTETADLALRHARWFAAPAESALPDSSADAEHFAVAVEALLPAHPAEALRGVLQHLPAIQAGGRSELAREWLRRGVQAVGPHDLDLRARGLAELSRLSFWVDLFEAEQAGGEAAAIWRQHEQPRQEAAALTHRVRCQLVLGEAAGLNESVSRLEWLRRRAGDDEQLAVQATVGLFVASQVHPTDLPSRRRDLQRCLAWFEAQHDALEAAVHQQRLATLAVFEGNLDDAEYWLDQSDGILAAHGSADSVRSQWVRTMVALHRDDLPRALAASRIAVRTAIRLGGRWPLIHGLGLLADALSRLEHPEPAARLLGQARSRQQRERLTSAPSSPTFFAPGLEPRLRHQLGLEPLERLLAAGATDSLVALLDQVEIGLHLDTELR